MSLPFPNDDPPETCIQYKISQQRQTPYPNSMKLLLLALVTSLVTLISATPIVTEPPIPATPAPTPNTSIPFYKSTNADRYPYVGKNDFMVDIPWPSKHQIPAGDPLEYRLSDSPKSMPRPKPGPSRLRNEITKRAIAIDLADWIQGDMSVLHRQSN